MSRVSRALPHLSAESLKQKFRTAKNFWQQQKWLVIYNALVDPREAKEIAKHILKQVSQEFADYFIVMQVDRAGWHRSDTLVVPENIRLILQPPHSPELNPTEHIWEELREQHFYNQVFESIDAVMGTLCQGLQELMRGPERLKSMTNFPHLRLTC